MDSVTSIPKGFNPTVGGYFSMDSVTSIPKGFNPTVGGNFYMNAVTSIPRGFNPTVGGNFYMNAVTSIPRGFNPQVGGYFSVDSVTSVPEYTKINGDFIDFQNGFIKCDGIFMQVDSHKGNVWIGHRIASEKKMFLVTDGAGKYSHGSTLSEAKEDLIFKLDNRRKEDFAHLTTKDSLLFEEAIVAYRVITGACGFGVEDYIQNRLPQKQESFLVSEIMELTKDEYGGKSFAEFIKN